MTTEVLGNLSFLDTPTVNGLGVMLNAGGTPSILSDTTANRPAAGTVGRLFVDTTTKVMYRDNGATWDSVGSAGTYTGTANQIGISGSVISLVSNPILPGLAGYTPPSGATADRAVSPPTGQTRWNTTLGYHELFDGATWIPQGRVLQVVSGTIAAATGATAIPFDNTTPLITEGTAIWSTTFTPLSAASRIIISFSLSHSNSNTSTTNLCSVFYGATLAGAAISRIVANNASAAMSFQSVTVPGNTTPVTVQARFGGSTTTTWYVNQTNTVTLGGALATEYTIMEIL
jgi:hypothetical protein